MSLKTTPSDVEITRGDFSHAIYWTLLLCAIVLALTLAGAPGPENDLFWQLRTGHDIVQSGSIPHKDPYSWTRLGHSWTVHEWLSLILFWIAYSKGGGFFGVFVLKMAVIGATTALQFTYLCRASGYRLIPAFLLTVVALWAEQSGFEARPQIFTYAFLVICTSIVLTGRDSDFAGNRILLLIPLFFVWANLHSGVLVGLALMGCWSAGDLLDGYLGPISPVSAAAIKRGLRLSLLTGICLLATFITPYGLAEPEDFVKTIENGSVLNNVSEWASPTLHSAVGINFLVVVLLMATGLIFTRRRILTGDLFATVIVVHSALFAVRNVPLFAYVGLMTLCPHLFSAISSILGEERITPAGNVRYTLFSKYPSPFPAIVCATGCLTLAILSTIVSLKLNLDWQEDSDVGIGTRLSNSNVDLAYQPDGAVALLNSGIFPTKWKMYNDYNDGGYLIWKLHRYPVAIDGRADVYFGDTVEDYLRINRMSYDWKQIIDKYSPDFVLTSSDQTLPKLLICSRDWALVYVGNDNLDAPTWPFSPENSMIFVKRTAASEPVIDAARRTCPSLQSKEFRSKYGVYLATE